MELIDSRHHARHVGVRQGSRGIEISGAKRVLGNWNGAWRDFKIAERSWFKCGLTLAKFMLSQSLFWNTLGEVDGSRLRMMSYNI